MGIVSHNSRFEAVVKALAQLKDKGRRVNLRHVDIEEARGEAREEAAWRKERKRG